MKYKYSLLFMLLSCLMVFGNSNSTAAQKISTLARQAFLIDITTNTVLFEKNPDQKMGPSSMSKILTLYLLFEALKNQRFTLDDELLVSKHAASIKGSTMFLEAGQRVRVEDLIRGIIVLSGNDASRVIAEALSGSEEQFAEHLNQKAQELGLDDSHFSNSSGWPSPNHYSTARDIATLSLRMIEDFPEYYHYYAETEFVYGENTQYNRYNRLKVLLQDDLGVDGLKTGQTEKAGYGLVISASQDNRRLVLVLNGLLTKDTRVEQAKHLLFWGFKTFRMYTLFQAGETIDYIPVWLGTTKNFAVTVLNPLRVTLTQKQRQDMQVSLTFRSPIPAPIHIDDVVGDILVTAPDGFFRQVPLIAAISVDKLGFFGRVLALYQYFLLGWTEFF